MTKKEYQKPMMKVIEADSEQEILTGSVTNLTTSGLEDDLVLPDEEKPKSGNVWDDAW